METTLANAQNNPVVKTFLQAQIKYPQKFTTLIHEDDEMYLYSLQNLNGDKQEACLRYYSLGKRIFDAVKQIVEWHFHQFDNLSSFLDFASGYGRFTRFLLQELPPNKIWVSDIYQAGVKFQIEQFGVNGIVSVEAPQDYATPQQFDCILASSFFSHTPKTTFAPWLEKLYSLLNPNGILIFSVHDISLIPPDVALNAGGIYFTPESESRTLDKQLYGTAYVSEEFVSQIIKQIIGNSAAFTRIPKGLCHYQDIYAIVKNPNIKFSALNFHHHPDGWVDNCNFAPTGELQFHGWALDFNQNGGIEDIQILVNGKILQRCLPDRERPDVAAYFQNNQALHCGWFCFLAKDVVEPDDVILVKVINQHKLERVIASGTLQSLVK
ncbi:class I SAM-dependent methyltransferase [Microseira wollei]|uniref:class I SAM-dependent methyltransferase n=1 Tax=Microseira wollei TaxID=467598 RepID=UPI001CFDA312|nr:class I SAM-dependent methyltransferase [Microseira wollei]